MFKNLWLTAMTTLGGGIAFNLPALAQDGRIGVAKERQMDFQAPATEIMDGIVGLHGTVFIIISIIVAVVLGLLLYVMIRYNRKTNPTPSKTSHNTLLEVVWTVIPIVILVYIGYYSVKLLYKQDIIPEADMVITATGHQWYWTYGYPEEGIRFDANMVPASYVDGTADAATVSDWNNRLEELRVMLGRDTPIEPRRLLDTDTRIVIPVDTTVKVLVTADDVIHSFTVPAFGFKIDAIPGKTNETWFKVREIGTYYGQCSELCGIRHAFMPIVIEVVSQEDYQAWLARAKNFYADGRGFEGPRVAENSGQ